jgi:hypothetical protein
MWIASILTNMMLSNADKSFHIVEDPSFSFKTTRSSVWFIMQQTNEVSHM